MLIPGFCSITFVAFLCNCHLAFFSSRLACVNVVLPYRTMDTAASWKNWLFILSDRSRFHMTDSCLCFCLSRIDVISRYLWRRCSCPLVSENYYLMISRRYPAKTITDADSTDDIVILANTPNQAETLLHSLERAAAGIGLHVNAHKTEYMCYNPTGDITTLDGTSLKLVDKFTYIGNSVSSTEKDIDTRLMKA